MKRVFSVVLPWLSSPVIVARFHDVRPVDATFERLANVSQLPGAPSLRLSSSEETEDLLSTKFPQAFESTLKRGGRRVRVSPWVGPDSTATYEVYVALRAEEDFAPCGTLIRATWGVVEILTLLTDADPSLASIGIDPATPTIRGLREGREKLPECGYFGSMVVRKLGADFFRDVLKGCGRVEFLRGGGLFYCWSWESMEALRTREYTAFRSPMPEILKRLSDAISG